jgi:hypothetical protein
MAVPQNADQVRIQALGFSVDETPGGATGAGDINLWRSGGGAGGRNVLNTAVQGGTIDPVPNRAINFLYGQLSSAETTVNGFEDRFNDVVGEETGPDATQWAAIGKNLIHAVHESRGWEGDFTNIDTWTCPHALDNKYVSVLAIKSDGTIMIPDIDYAAATTSSIVLHFTENVTGHAIIRR